MWIAFTKLHIVFEELVYCIANRFHIRLLAPSFHHYHHYHHHQHRRFTFSTWNTIDRATFKHLCLFCTNITKQRLQPLRFDVVHTGHISQWKMQWAFDTNKMKNTGTKIDKLVIFIIKSNLFFRTLERAKECESEMAIFWKMHRLHFIETQTTFYELQSWFLT